MRPNAGWKEQRVGTVIGEAARALRLGRGRIRLEPFNVSTRESCLRKAAEPDIVLNIVLR